MQFSYPISAIAGKNGSGKSTMLAISACAYHSRESAKKYGGSIAPYYTFSDFFIQTKNEKPPKGIRIQYGIFSNNWANRNGQSFVGYQTRRKPVNGRWNNYEKRFKRNTLFLGTLRVASSHEISALKAYSKRFIPCSTEPSISDKICEIAARIFDKEYSGYEEYKHGKFSIPSVTTSQFSYSSFNMGSGEASVLRILQAIFLSEKGLLLVIDEIELGLHPSAQRKLIAELKQLCFDHKCQIICTTHSPVIIDSLPLDARFYVENVNDSTRVQKGVSSEFTLARLSDESQEELTAFVEDEVALAIVTNSLSCNLRSRVRVVVIGSSQAVLSQLISRFRENRPNCMALLDGDKRNEHAGLESTIKSLFASNIPTFIDVKRDIVPRVKYLPGDSWPERELLINVQSNEGAIQTLEQRLRTEPGIVSDNLSQALNQTKHNELRFLSERFCVSRETLLTELVKSIDTSGNQSYQPIEEMITEILSEL
jgi:predicted ATPase